MPLRVYNTLKREKLPFEPVQSGKVGMYVCGPTVYKPSHIGHMVGPVIFDTVKRYLAYLGYEVHWVVNITDVDDKLIVRAKELGTTVKELAERMTADYLAALKSLNVTGIDRMPKATEHIPEMIQIIQGLIDKGYAYPSHGDVYFEVGKDADYGKLCNRDPEQLEAGTRIEVSERKRNPGDFALWKGAKPGEPSWESPWGPGRPGWHIECSAMSMKYLGKTLDIHGGGLDLQFPHHENELAQSESFTDQPFARYWMHNGLLKMGQTKMAGSVGNVINVADLLQKHSPETVRFLLLGTHYRSPIEYSEDRLNEVKRSLEGFYRFFERYQRITGESFYAISASTRYSPIDLPEVDSGWGGGLENVPLEFTAITPQTPGWEQFGGGIGCYPAGFVLMLSSDALRTRFLAHMDDDFNTGGAVGVLYDMLSELNRFVDSKKLEHPDRLKTLLPDFQRAVCAMKEMAQILGLFWQAPKKETGGNDQLVNGLMQLLIDLRADARKTKNFAVADQIRKRLGELGVTIEDRAGGTGWRVQ